MPAPDDQAPPSEDEERSCLRKKRYGDPALAEQVADRCWRKRGVELRVYPCTYCGGFHLTKATAPPRRG